MMHNNYRYIRKPRLSSYVWQKINQFDWRKKRFWLIGSVIFILTFVAGHSGVYTQLRLWHQGHTLQNAIELERKKKIWLQNEARSLREDLTRIEREVRQEHGMGNPDEIIIKIP